MKRLFITAVVLLVAGGIALAAAGITTLPTGWRIRGADGPVATVGTLPTGLALSRDGTRVFVLETGHRKPVLRVLDAATLKELRSLRLNGAFGAPLREAQSDRVWVATAGTFREQVALIDTGTMKIERTASLPVPFYPVALAQQPNGALAVAGDLADRVAFVDPRAAVMTRSLQVGHHPGALAFSPRGTNLYVAERGSRFVDVVGINAAHIEVGLHPAALAVDQRFLYVAVSDDDTVVTIDLATNRVVQRLRIPFARADAVGTSPNALTLSGGRLYVPCGAANAVAVFRTGPRGLAPLGAIPAGWYPTAVAVDETHHVLFVADGKGESGHPNPQYKPGARGEDAGYVADNLLGSIRRVEIPDDAALARGLGEVKTLAQRAALPPHPIVRAGGPIKHVIYVIKENRAYDQVLGDLAGADGDASLAIYGEKVTPNQHALAKRFGVFDRFFENAHVSADGHNWSDAAFANDYVERMWPAQYASRRPYYDFEDGAEAAVPHAGYLWNNASAHKLSVRDYGEYTTEAPAGGGPTSTMDPFLNAHTDHAYPTFDMEIEDMSRFAEWKREFDAYEATRTLPQLEIMVLPRDHTAGTRSGSVRPEGMVADNDLAVGKLVEAVSHSPDWASTAIFIVEDDAQNGPDHVDEQRAPFYLISPYAAGGVQHAMYTQASVLRTIEVLLGLPPMSAYDAGAVPLTAAFATSPTAAPYDAIPAQIDVRAKNGPTAYRAAESARLDFAHADGVDDATLNDILWHAAKGASASLPPYGAFSAPNALH